MNLGFVEDAKWVPFNGNVFGCVTDGGYFVLGDMRRRKPCFSIKVSTNELNSLDFSCSGRVYIAAADSGGYVSIFDLRQTGLPFSILGGVSSSLTQVAFSPLHRNVIATGSIDGVTCVWGIGYSARMNSGNGICCGNGYALIDSGTCGPIVDMC